MTSTTLQSLCRRIEETLEEHRLVELAHELKGAAGNAGAAELAQIAETLERQLKNDVGLPSIRSTIETLGQACERLRTRLDEEMNKEVRS